MSWWIIALIILGSIIFGSLLFIGLVCNFASFMDCIKEDNEYKQY